MAHNREIRFRCRALFEVMNMTLSSISDQENVGISTLSDWKNDDREEYGGIWLRGCKADKVAETTKKLQEELRATSVYDELQKNLVKYGGVDNDGSIIVDGILNLASDNEQLQQQAEADMIMLGAVQADWFDAQMFKNSMLSSVILSNQVKNDVTKIKQTDIKASSEIHKLAKESRFGKSPDTVIFNANGNYSAEELDGMSMDELEKIVELESKKTVDSKVIDGDKVSENS